MLHIDKEGRIFLDGRDIGLSVTQAQNGTQVYRRCVLHRGEVVVPWQEYSLPRKRYSLSYRDTGHEGVGTLHELEADILKYCDVVGV